MKVLHVNNYFERLGGAETILFNTLRALQEKGIENTVAYGFPQKNSLQGEDAGWPAHYIPRLDEVEPWAHREANKIFIEILQSEKPDIIHLYDIGNPSLPETSLRFAPTVQSVFNHSYYCPGGDKYLPFLGRACKKGFGPGCLASAFLTHCNSIKPRALVSSYYRSLRMLSYRGRLLFLTLSQYQADCLIQSGCPPGRAKVLPAFVDVPEEKREAAPSREGTLIFSGRVTVQKGLDLLLKALSQVHSAFKLYVDGDGSGLRRSEDIAEKLGLNGRVKFFGWLPYEEHLRHLTQADIAVLPSIWPEPYGMAGIEAMSFGKPVVAFKVGAVPEWLEEGVTGCLVRPYDIEEMTEKIDFLLQHPEERQKMGERARARVEKDFGREKYISRLMEIYRGLQRGG